MIYQIDRINKDVRVCMDQNITTEDLFNSGDIDSIMLDDIIHSKIIEAVERVHVSAPYSMLEIGHNFDNEADAVYWGTGSFDNTGWIILPEDFLRLIIFEMNDWERPVYQAIGQNDPEYKKQRSRVKALRGTAQRPVCAICMRPEGMALEFYSCKSQNASVRRAMYVPYPHIDDDGGIDISEKCYKAVVYIAAALTLTSCGEPEKAELFFNMSKTYLEK